MRLFLVIILFLWSAMHVYGFLRTSSVPVIARIFCAARLREGFFLLANYFVAQTLGHLGMKSLASVWERIEANWTGIIFLVLVAAVIC